MKLPTPADASSIVQRELGPQERLLWVGKPRAGLVLRPSDVFLIPFSLLWGGFAVKSLNLRTLFEMSLNERPDGSGTITFGQGNPYYWWFQSMGWWQHMSVVAPAFDLIPRAKEVYETLRSAQRSAT